MRRLFKWISLVGLAGLTACQSSSVNTVQPAVPTFVRQPVTDKRLVTDSKFNSTVNIVGLNQVITPGGFLSIQFEALNRTKGPVRFSYRFEWFDANGMLLDTPASGWHARQIEGGESLFIAGLAPMQTAKDFRIKLMSSHPE